MADYLLVGGKVESMKRKAEQRYKRFEEHQLKYAKHDFMSYAQVMAECTGYLKALADMELLEDLGESLNRMTKHVIEEQRKAIQ